MAAGILLLVAGVVVLSAATRRPCLQVSTGPWRLWKAGRMTKPVSWETCKLRVTAEAQAPQAAPQEALAPPPLIYFPPHETIPPILSRVAQIRHFRPPPALG